MDGTLKCCQGPEPYHRHLAVILIKAAERSDSQEGIDLFITLNGRTV